MLCLYSGLAIWIVIFWHLWIFYAQNLPFTSFPFGSLRSPFTSVPLSCQFAGSVCDCFFMYTSFIICEFSVLQFASCRSFLFCSVWEFFVWRHCELSLFEFLERTKISSKLQWWDQSVFSFSLLLCSYGIESRQQWNHSSLHPSLIMHREQYLSREKYYLQDFNRYENLIACYWSRKSCPCKISETFTDSF